MINTFVKVKNYLKLFCLFKLSVLIQYWAIGAYNCQANIKVKDKWVIFLVKTKTLITFLIVL